MYKHVIFVAPHVTHSSVLGSDVARTAVEVINLDPLFCGLNSNQPFSTKAPQNLQLKINGRNYPELNTARLHNGSRSDAFSFLWCV